MSVAKKSDLSDQVTTAELLFTDFLVEHNIPLAAADHSSKLFSQMFPDSEIQRNIKLPTPRLLPSLRLWQLMMWIRL
jgi:hypothetical protein